MWRMRTITILFGLGIATSVLFGQGTNVHRINTYYGCNVSLNCQGRGGVWYHNNRSIISNTSLQSVRFDDGGHYQCKTPSAAVSNEFTLHVYGLQGVAALNCSSVSNGVCVRNVMREQPVTLCATFTTFPSSVSEKYTSNLLGIIRSRWEVSSDPLEILVCRSEYNCSGDPAYHFHDDLKWQPCVTVTNVTEDMTFSYVINTRKVAVDVCPAPTNVVQSTVEFSIHLLDTPTVETTSIISSSSSSLSTSSSSHPSAVTPTVETTSIISSSSSSLSTSSSSHPSAITNTPVTTPSPDPGTVAAIVPIMVIIVTVVAMVLFILIAGMMCRARGGRDCSSVEDDKDNILDLHTRKKSRKSSFGPVIYAVSESTMEQLHISNTGEDAGYGNTVSNHSTPMDDAITEHSLASMRTCTIPPLTGSPPHEHSQTVRPDSLRIKGERKVDSGVSVWTSPSNSMFGPGLESNPSGGPGLESSPSGGPGLESSPSGGPGLDSNLSDKPLIPGDSDDVSENDFTEGFHTNVPKT